MATNRPTVVMTGAISPMMIAADPAAQELGELANDATAARTGSGGQHEHGRCVGEHAGAAVKFWGARYAIVDDPDGNGVGLMSPIEAARKFWPPAPLPRA